MGILFRNSKQIKERGNRVQKHQAGGTIPVYSNFQVQHAQSVPYNPSMLLAKYQQAAPAKTAASASGGAKPTKRDLPELKGLSNDATALGDEIAGLEMQFEAGMASDDNFANTPLGRNLRNRLDLSTSVRLNELRRAEEAYDASYKIMDETRHAQGAPVFDGSRYTAARWDSEKNLWEYKKITPQELHEEGSGWQALSYGDAANLRETSMDEKWLFSGEIGKHFVRDMSNAMSMDWIENNILDDNYTDIGKTISAEHHERGGGANADTGAILKKFVEGESTESNQAQLESALSKMRNYVGTNSAAWNALRGHFWLSSSSETEVNNKINLYLAKHMAQRLGYAVEVKDASVWETQEERELKGNESSSMTNLSVYVTEAAGLTKPNYVPHEMKLIKEPGYKSNMMTVTTWGAPETGKLLNPKEVISSNSAFNSAGDVYAAEDANGRDLKKVKIGWGRSGNFNFLDIAMPSKNNNMRLTVVPMKNGRVYRAAADQVEKLNTKIAKLEAERKAEGIKAKSGTELYNSYQAQIEAAKQEFMNDPKNQGIELEARYLVDVVYFDPGKQGKMKDMGKISRDDYTAYQKKFGKENGLIDNYAHGYKFWEWGKVQATSLIKEHLRKTTIMVPVRDLIQLQHLGANVKIQQGKVTAGSLVNTQNKSMADVTKEELYQAIKAKKFGEDESGRAFYNSIWLTDLLNK